MARVAIVTGGTRGIGRDISAALKAAGYTVAATYAGNEEAANLCSQELGITCHKFDVCSFDACHDAVKKITDEVGAPDIVVNNAGITKDGFLHKMTADQWHAVIETNLTSCFNMCSAVMPGMRDRGFGRIINISSINGQKGQLGQTNYSAAKAGMIGFTKALAYEGARKGITVNAICPGYIATDMTAKMDEKVLESIVAQIPVGRMGKPSEIADTVVFLARDDAAFITGATFSVNGGQYMA